MKLFYASASPFVRKCMVAAIELGLEDRLETVTVATSPVAPATELDAVNPLRKIPALVTDDEETLYDSAVICEYLDAIGGNHLIPQEGAARWAVRRQESLADGLLDAAVITRYEMAVRPEEKRWDDWIAAQKAKIDGALGQMERDAANFGGALHLGAIAFGCALGYLDFRFADDGWRNGHDKLAAWYETFAQRPSMQRTAPAAA
jgi:glutathione S-transferase